jgi:pimeloyl-ACP methyl ester carboxylesterase
MLTKIRFIMFGFAVISSLLVTSCSYSDPFAGAYTATDENVKLYVSDLEKDLKNYEGPARNPVIVIHGFLGAKLKDINDGTEAWGEFTGRDIIDGFSDKYLNRLSYPMEYGKTLSQLKSNVVPYAMMTDIEIKVLGVTFDQSAYQEMLNIFISKGFIPENKLKEKKKNFASLYLFYYDWRRNNVQNAQQLHKFILEKRAKLQKKYEELYGLKNFDVKFNIVAHSMGGMITRYMLMYGDQTLPDKGEAMPIPDWRGSQHVERAVIVGTPNLGYLNVCFEMTQGLSIAKEVPALPPAMLGTWATYYQMLPFPSMKSVRYADAPDGPALNLYDPQVWIDLKWGLADPAQDNILKIMLPKVKTTVERREIALDHQKKCLRKAAQFSQAVQAQTAQPKDLALFLFLGDSMNTRKTAVVDKKTGKLKLTSMDGGDGVVPTVSARMDTIKESPELPFKTPNIDWHSVVHLNAAHMGITEAMGFGDNVTYYLMLLPVHSSKARRTYLKRVLNSNKKYMKYFRKYKTSYK